MGNSKNKKISKVHKALEKEQRASEKIRKAEEQLIKEAETASRLQAQRRRREETRLAREREIQCVVDSNLHFEDQEDQSTTNRLKRWKKCSNVSDELVHHLHIPTTRLTMVEKKDTLRRFCKDPRICTLLPEHIQNMNDTDKKLQVLQSVQEAYNHMVANKSAENSAFRNALLSSVVSSQGPGIRYLSNTFNAGRFILKSAVKRRVQMDDTGDNIWGGMPRKERSDKLSSEDTAVILSWYDTATTISPNKKDIKRQRVGVNTFIKHPTHYLQESQLEFYTRFKKEHPSVNVGIRAFENLKPYYVRRLKERNTCACKYHVEMRELLNGWNNMRTGGRGVHGKDCVCFCDVCSNSSSGHCLAERRQFQGLTDMWTSILCPLEEDGWYKLDCLLGDCPDCGVDMLVNCPVETTLDCHKLVEWTCYKKVVAGKTKMGKEYKVLKLVYRQTPPRVFLDYLTPKLQAFVRHNFVSKWEEEQYKVCLQTFPESSIMSVIDFAENYSFVEFNEIQEMHWTSTQLTILVHISYRWNEEYLKDPQSGLPKFIPEYHYYISDDMKHDTLFVQHCFKLHWDGLTTRGLIFNQHLVWSDGCAAQFKGRTSMYHVARYQSITRNEEHLPNGCQMIWSFFGSGHGKGVHDGAGAVLKQAIRMVQMSMDAPKLESAADVVALCIRKQKEEHAAYKNIRRDVKRFFYLVEEVDINRKKLWDCKKIPGSQKMHSVASVSHRDFTLLKVRDLACFCAGCMDDNCYFCEAQSYVKPWKLITLEPDSLVEVRVAMSSAAPNIGSNIERISVGEDVEDEDDEDVILESEGEKIELGFTFAVVVEEMEKNDPFFIILCDKPKYRNPVNFIDDYGNEWFEGDMLIRGFYYERISVRQRGNIISYYLQKEKFAYAHSHHVICSGFAMLPNYTPKGLPRFSMSLEVRDEVLNAFENRTTLAM